MNPLLRKRLLLQFLAPFLWISGDTQFKRLYDGQILIHGVALPSSCAQVLPVGVTSPSPPFCGRTRAETRQSTAATKRAPRTSRCTGSGSCRGKWWSWSSSPRRAAASTTSAASARRNSQPPKRRPRAERWRWRAWSRQMKACTSAPWVQHSGAGGQEGWTKTQAANDGLLWFGLQGGVKALCAHSPPYTHTQRK